MRILFVSTAFPQPYEPSRNPDNLERCLALARDHHVQVIAPRHWTRVRPGQRSPQIAGGSRLAISRPLAIYPPGLLRRTHAWWMWQSIRGEAQRLRRTFHPDGVIGYWTYPDSAVALRLARHAQVPCVAIVGGSDVLAIDPARPGPHARRVTSVLDGVDAVAAVSASLATHLEALGVRRDKIHVLSPAVDQRVFHPGSQIEARQALGLPTTTPMVVWVGRMVDVKALDILIEAIGTLVPAHPTLALYLIGDGPLRRALERQVAARGLDSHIVFTGCVPHRELPIYYRAATVTALPSHWEGMPNVLLESHACGTPFVATRVGAIPALARPGVDDVVTPGDVGALTSALASHLARTHAAAMPIAMGGWDRVAEQLVDLLAAAGQRRNSNAPASAPAPFVARVAPR